MWVLSGEWSTSAGSKSKDPTPSHAVLELDLRATRDGVLVVAHDAIAAVTEKLPDEITPTPDAWRDILHPEDLPEVARRSEEAIRTGGEFYAEFRARRTVGKAS